MRRPSTKTGREPSFDKMAGTFSNSFQRVTSTTASAPYNASSRELRKMQAFFKNLPRFFRGGGIICDYLGTLGKQAAQDWDRG